MQELDFHDQVKAAALMFARWRYEKRYPDAPEDEVMAHASRCWRMHVDTALDFLVACRILDEQDEAARQRVN